MELRKTSFKGKPQIEIGGETINGWRSKKIDQEQFNKIKQFAELEMGWK